MKNIAGVEITRPNQKLILMRSLPGAGKSTRAKELVGSGIIHSTDEVIRMRGDYNEHFKKMKEANDFSPHGKMHLINFNNAKESLLAGLSPVIIDNTNIRMSECRKYVEMALFLGLDDKNIVFEDLGDSGLSSEELCARNANGVPLEIIEAMRISYNSSGRITVKRIWDTRGTNSNGVIYSGVMLDEKSRTKLLKVLGHQIPSDWEVIAHHMTITFGKPIDEKYRQYIDAYVPIKVIEIGKSDMAIAVKVEGFPSDNKIPHITLGVNRVNGGKPVLSNDITNWTPLENYINIGGIVTEVTKHNIDKY